MKLIVSCVVLLIGVNSVLSAPQGNPDDIKLVRYVNDNNGIDGYKFTYELSDGQIRSEAGQLKEIVDAEGKQAKAIVVSGSYTFVGPDGLIYWVNYTADENGYHPVVGTGPEGGIKPGQDAGIDPSALRSLVG